jgi:hypothetical protein
MDSTLSVMHRLGLAAAFGGMLFGKVGLDPSVDAIALRPERGRVLTRSWVRWSLLGGPGLAAAAITWWLGRSRAFPVGGRAARAMYATDVLLALASVSGTVNVIAGMLLASSAPRGAVPLETGMRSGPEMSRRQRGLLRTMVVGGWLQLAAIGGALAAEAVLDRERVLNPALAALP